MSNTINPDAALGAPLALTREDADRLYRATGAVADPGAVMADFIARSHVFRERHPGILDIAYGAGEDEVLDIFLPRHAEGLAPVHIFIHGGYWYQFGKDEWSFVAEALTASGAIVVVPRHALCPAVGIADIVRQMQAMLAWLWHHIGQHGGDRERMFVSGHSAGGHLAMELHLTDWQACHGLPADMLKGVAVISGLYDLRPLIHSYVQAHIGLSEHEARQLSPLLRIGPSATPLIIAVAQADPPGFHGQAAQLAGLWRAQGNPLRLIDVDDRNHLTELYELSCPDGVLARAIGAQMGLAEG